MSYARDLVAESKVKNDLKEVTGTTGNYKNYSLLKKREMDFQQFEFSK